MFRYGSVEIHPIVIDTVMVKRRCITEYQVHQTDGGVHVDVVAHDGIAAAVLAAEIEKGLRHAGLVNAAATVAVVKEIPSHPETGKTRRFVALT